MSFTISKDFGFSAAHQLAGLADGHPCGREHGHNYLVRATLTAPWVDGTGFVLDYGDLKPFGRWIDEHLDHQRLNDVPALGGANPTAEHLARTLHEVLHEVLPQLGLRPEITAEVSVSETPKTWATYRADLR